MTLADLAANVTATLTELKLASHELILVGHSMSGMLVNYITATCPELNISRNVLVAPVHPSAQLSGAIGSRIGVLEEAQQLGPLGNSIPDAATGPGATGLQRAFIRLLILGNSVEGYCANCRAIMSGETCGLDYAKVKVPTLVVYGKYDKTSPWTGCIEEIAKGLRDVVTLKELPVGHWIAIEDDEGLASIMKEFIIN
ncbi:hypothetical protein Cantr_07204 [Candida viswanathii]|uniref:AB hydrolase-1 domain-containing protein n=1 Tax=Candida viswanathii TaxID=5486 RepID=A0A367Y0U7_9ASCO|nr:hypothetical protein Cantr_07204 [Candida viswanathii]